MTSVSVDLASRDYGDLGVAVLESSPLGIDVSFVRPELTGNPKPRELAEFLVRLCKERGAKTLLLDGPQAWKDPSNGLEHSRLCEQALNTPARTGLPGTAKPRNYGHFVAFSISVFDELTSLGRPRYTGQELPGVCVAAESFPLSAWRTLKLPPLPAKRKCGKNLLAERAFLLSNTYALRLERSPTHDELQATFAGPAGPPLECRDLSRLKISGAVPFDQDCAYREGFIVNPASDERARDVAYKPLNRSAQRRRRWVPVARLTAALIGRIQYLIAPPARAGSRHA